jgi:DNA polymerase III subunit chi
VTRIDFYVGARDRIDVACRLAAKAVQAKTRLIVYAPDETVLAKIDRLLWTQSAIGFIPHCMSHDPLASETPVLLARNIDSPPVDDVILNLADACPPTFARFQRLLEIVSQDDADKAAARERFRFYRDRGYRIETHNLSDAAGRSPG